MGKVYILTPLAYPGGKTKTINKMKHYFPRNYQEFREPLVGGGSVTLYFKQSYPERKYWINDLNKNLITFWKVLKKDYALLSEAITEQRKETDSANSLVERLKIKLSSIQQNINSLSGGNQQKTILARWLDSNARIIIFDEPTRGIDVAAKAQIHQLMRELVEQGASIIMISSELPEILEMGDRVIVMHEGKITGEMTKAEATEEKIITLATQE